jgi:hypothetical protein
MEQSLKYNVNYDKDKEFTLTQKDIHAVINKCEDKGRVVNWIKDMDDNILAERLHYSKLEVKQLKDE